MSETSDSNGTRLVWANGTGSRAMQGDPEYVDEYSGTDVLPRLLHEGWRVESVVPVGNGAYFVLTGRPTPAPVAKHSEPSLDELPRVGNLQEMP